MKQSSTNGFLLAALIVGVLAIVLTSKKSTEPEVTSVEGATNEIQWLTSLAPALVQAKETGKPIMIDFFATWCPPCKMLDAKTYTDAKVQARSKDWIMVRIDVDQNKALAREYQIASIPTLVLVQPDGKEAARELGFIPPAEMLAFMSKVKPARVDSVPSPTAGNLAPTQPADQRLSDLP